MIRPSTILALCLVTLVLASNAYSADKNSDCVSCNTSSVPGLPNTRPIENLAKVTARSKFQSDDFQAYLQSYCMKFEQVTSPHSMKKEIIEPMRKTPYSFEQYWTQAECRPVKIGATLSPLIHLAADETFGRRVWLETLYKHLTDKKELNIWNNIVNAKNTRGQTVLDYIAYIRRDKQYRDEEVEDVNALLKFLCEKGATFAVEKTLKCPYSI